MPFFDNFLGARATQDIDNVIETVIFAGTFDTGKEFLGGDSEIDVIVIIAGTGITHITIIFIVLFIEVVEKGLTATFIGFSEIEHRL